MPSLRSHIAALVLRNWHRTAFTSAEGMHRWIQWARQRQNHRPPAAMRERFDISERQVDGFPVYEVRPRRAGSRLKLLYLHGGAFIFEIGSYHWNLIGELAERLGADVTVPVYPLAPEYGFQDIFGMGMAVYRGMLDEAPAGDIVFVGDSAGGTMAIVMTMMAAEQGLPAPAAHVLISPGLDMSLANPQVHEFARADPWLAIPGGLEALRLFAGEFEPTDWRISPIYGDLSVLPKTLLFTGTRDILHPDGLLFAERAKARGVEVDVVVGRGMMHVWPLIGLPESRPARDRMVAFLRGVEGRDAENGMSLDGALAGAATDRRGASGGWPFGAALTALMSRFGSFG
jgi:acetyl esterase/lipase